MFFAFSAFVKGFIGCILFAIYLSGVGEKTLLGRFAPGASCELPARSGNRNGVCLDEAGAVPGSAGQCLAVRQKSFCFRESSSMDHVRPTTNLAKKPPQRLAQEKDRTHERDATPMGYEPNRVMP